MCAAALAWPTRGSSLLLMHGVMLVRASGVVPGLLPLRGVRGPLLCLECTTTCSCSRCRACPCQLLSNQSRGCPHATAAQLCIALSDMTALPLRQPQFARKVVAARRSSAQAPDTGGADLLSLFTAMRDEASGQPLSDELLVDYVLNFIIAGRWARAGACWPQATGCWSPGHLLHTRSAALGSAEHWLDCNCCSTACSLPLPLPVPFTTT